MGTALTVLAQDYGTSGSSGGAAVGAIIGGIGLAFAVLMIVALWRIFTKAGEPGWAAIIPVYNWYVLLKITGKPWWWLLLFFIPLVNLVLEIIVVVELAKRFGKGAGFAVGMIFLPFIFYPILGFGSAQYAGSLGGQQPAGQ